MKKPKIKYIVNLHGAGYDEKYDDVVETKETFYTRGEFAQHYGSEITVNGITFPVEAIRAEPIKYHSFPEIIVIILVVALLLYFVPGTNVHFSAGRWTIVMLLSYLVGFLMGRLKMYGQQADADYFNKS